MSVGNFTDVSRCSDLSRYVLHNMGRRHSCAQPTDKHLDAMVDWVDDEIIEWLKRHEPFGRNRLAGGQQSVYRYLP